jgi:hypothetical protein
MQHWEAKCVRNNEVIQLLMLMKIVDYWNTLVKNAAFRGRTLDECLKVIRTDITQVWNFNDPDRVRFSLFASPNETNILQWLIDDRINGCLLRTDNLEGDTGAAASSNG